MPEEVSVPGKEPEAGQLGADQAQRHAGGEEMTAIEIINEVAEEMCNDYCKYPDTWDAEKEGVELCESEICQNCPLNRL